MSDQRQLTDRAALEMHRRRAWRSDNPSLFLHEAALAEIQLRLNEINRSFDNGLIVTGFPEYWSEMFPRFDIVPDRSILNIEAGQRDLVLHCMALHWANDPIGQLVQCRMALKADGLLLAVCLGGATLNELRHCLLTAETEVCCGASPRIAPMASLQEYGMLLQRAGLALSVTDKVTINSTYESCHALMRDLRAMGETNALAERSKRISPRSLFAKAEQFYTENHSTQNNRLHATFELIFLTGWAPAQNQQKPLRPGSAQTSLASELSSVEHRLTK